MAVEGWHHISPHPPQLFSGRYVDGEPRRGWGGAFCFSGDLVAVENLGRETGANVTGMAVAGAEDYGGLPLSLPSFCQTAICGLGQPVQLVVGDGGGSTNLVMPPEIGHPSSLAIHRQSSELDRVIDQYTRRMTVEIEGIVRGQTKEVVAAFQQQILRRLREKDEEMQRMEKLNLVLQERITALTAENQLLRGLAATSEAAVNSLRSNLEQVMAVAEVEEDAESCCWSGGGGSAVAAAAQEEQEEGSRRGRAACCCRGCGEEEEPSVVVLPCRHLCLCTQCGSKVRGCPVCGCVMTGKEWSKESYILAYIDILPWTMMITTAFQPTEVETTWRRRQSREYFLSLLQAHKLYVENEDPECRAFPISKTGRVEYGRE